MFTYLTILFSFLVLVGIFVHRALQYSKKLKAAEAAKVAEANKPEGGDEDEEAVKIRLSKSDKEKVEELCQRGEELIKTGKDEEAVKCFVQALTINSQHIETQHRLALLYLQKQMYGAAAALFQQLAVQTNDAVHYSHWGLALYQQSDFENAKAAYQTAVDLDPTRPQRFVSLAQVYKATSQLTNAIIAINKAIEMEDKNLEFLYLLADLQLEANNYIAAKETLNKLFEIDAGNRPAKIMMKEIRKLEKAAGG